MHKIAICDDILSELKQIDKLLTLYFSEKNINYTVKSFEDAADLFSCISEKEYVPDLILTDIYTKEMTGLDAVSALQEIGFDIPVIFTTISEEHALEAYNLNAIQYLLKPLDQEKFFHALDISFLHIEQRKEKEDKIAIKMTDGVCSICADDIVYCETRRNYQFLCLEGGEQRTRMTSVELYDLLKDSPQFIKCGRSYIVNMNHVVKVNKEEVHMDNGSKIYLPKNKVAEFANAYFEYFCYMD